jgi:hypothetical protein
VTLIRSCLCQYRQIQCLIHLPLGLLLSSLTPWRYIYEILFPPNLRLLRKQRRYLKSSGLYSGIVRVQRVDTSTEFLVSISSSSSSLSSTSVDGMRVEAEADGFEVLEDGDMHILGRVAGSGQPVSDGFGYRVKGPVSPGLERCGDGASRIISYRQCYCRSRSTHQQRRLMGQSWDGAQVSPRR